MRVILSFIFLLLLFHQTTCFEEKLKILVERYFFPNGVESRMINLNKTTYSYSEWSEFSVCNKICGGGIQKRSRSCISSNGENVTISNCRSNIIPLSPYGLLLQYVDKNLIETQTQPCNFHPCTITEWSEWSNCSRVCGRGQQNATRRCLDDEDQSKCVFISRKIRFCNQKSCFKTGEWSEFSDCSHDCGGGVRTRSRACIPNVPEDHPYYDHLQNIIDKLQSPGFQSITLLMLSSDVTIREKTDFVQTCQLQTLQKSYCNIHSCPACPKNQIYHHCKPCVSRCYPTDIFKYLTSFLNGEIYPMTSSGCDGVCEKGCGCPSERPFLSSTETCYTFPFECPMNSLGPFVSQVANFGPTSQPYDVSTTTVDDVTTSTTDDVITSGLPKCFYNVIIATKPGFIPCNCDGRLETTSCYLTADTSCPVYCRRQRKLNCPRDDVMPILKKFGRDCGKSFDECDVIKNDCVNENDVCCKTECGLKCVVGQIE